MMTMILVGSTTNARTTGVDGKEEGFHDADSQARDEQTINPGPTGACWFQSTQKSKIHLVSGMFRVGTPQPVASKHNFLVFGGGAREYYDLFSLILINVATKK